ncbi:MAG: HisA/HisF-related TIM barrel protein [Candidatus Bathyarchaeota archaeon]|nr:HisA/HisF-related TIM barrel protein [Candidatus Bathyarchaeota archaeon]
MDIIPVIDILNNEVVHAVKGNRTAYKPLQSRLCNSTDPAAVALMFKGLGFKKLYIADLDAILGKGDNTEVFRKISSQTGLQLIVDAGVTEIKKAQVLFKNKVNQIVIGTETLKNLNFVRDAIKLFGTEKIMVSLDLMKDKVLCKSELVNSMDALEIASEIQKMGVSQIIFLDLARVGSNEGVDMARLKKIKSGVSAAIFIGGGVRNLKDILLLYSMKVSGVLVATSLHLGQLTVEELKQANLI